MTMSVKSKEIGGRTHSTCRQVSLTKKKANFHDGGIKKLGGRTHSHVGGIEEDWWKNTQLLPDKENANVHFDGIIKRDWWQNT